MTFVLNPVAGGYRGRREHPLLARIQAMAPDAECLVTSREGDAQTLAHERAGDANRVVVAVGGDGTVHEVACGLVSGQLVSEQLVSAPAAMAVLPLGSGNDFARMLHSPPSLEAALPWWANARTRRCDIGQVRITTQSGKVINSHFINSLGIGFEADVAERAGRARYLKGFSRYLFAALVHLFRFRAPAMTLRWNDQTTTSRQFLIALGNGRCAGGGFMLTPEAEIDDGQLEMCRADDLPIYRLLRILPSVMRGNHTRFQGVHADQLNRISIECPGGCGLHADGESLARNATRIEVSVLPGALRLLG